MNVIAEIQRINQAELENGSVGTGASWHAKYADSAWVYAGNIPIQLTEGDIICVMSQFGEILGRSIRVDHVEKYRLPKHLAEEKGGDSVGADAGALSNQKHRTAPGHAYQGQELASAYDISKGQDLFAAGAIAMDPTTGRRSGGAVAEHDTNDEAGMSKDERREAKRARKEERSKKRREKEAKRMKKEEKRRERRARKMRHDQDAYYLDSPRGENRSDRKKESKRKRRRRRSRSHSPSASVSSSSSVGSRASRGREAS
mmetsp:Transcript_4998/g.9661  ORF Transcript_4998/g.9661 Transcript_4998/m.9661 type:complete len:258 (+) Transcript_4998:158-931(+)|eukprot:CAMPEP_0178711922 /NCGR_PEP_ID=MMETSP0699-20121125/18606_1 /TAXON_ID=265572 /ORGANISM="Extubocellulus spinifer, Strain CCMP396" /LENGTH=257 /DNA_ID=CAMNT_0020360637 /DNA_START=76 /DNA_END=849 /DNA_ORIENTATION=+